MEERRGLTIKDLLIRLILIIIFIFLLIWLFPMPNLKPLNNQIFADNVDRMKEVAKSYYTTERLPQNVGESKRMTLGEMQEKDLILPLMDSKGKYCSKTNSYVEITKMENEYLIVVNLSCSDKQARIIEHFGCYDICSDTCKALEKAATTKGTTITYSTSRQAVSRATTKYTKKYTTKNTEWSTTQITPKLYEYEFVRDECSDTFDSYSCPTGYSLVGDSCMRYDAETETKDAIETKSIVSSVDTKDAKAESSSTTETKDPTITYETKTSTITAGYKKTTYSAALKTVTKKLTADETYSYDVKAAIETVKSTDRSYDVIQNYDVVDADVTYPDQVQKTEWKYVSTKVSTDGGLSFVGDTEKLLLVDSWQERTCSTCASVITYYKYYRYRLVTTTTTSGSPTYSCNSHPGYTLSGTKCKKATTKSYTCPSGWTNTGSGCKKTETSLSCDKYGSDYKLDKSKKTCTKTITKYSCSKGTLTDGKYCTVTEKDYVCPSNMEKQGTGADTVCIDKHDYYCPANTSTKTYTLNGTTCTVSTKVAVAKCDSGYTLSADGKSCVKKGSETVYTCDGYDGYTLEGNKCTKVINTEKITYSCEMGYTLDSNNKCTRTVESRDTIAATKNYKTVCHQEYKWSTSTKLDGWSYTGNKRQIN